MQPQEIFLEKNLKTTLAAVCLFLTTLNTKCLIKVPNGPANSKQCIFGQNQNAKFLLIRLKMHNHSSSVRLCVCTAMTPS